MQFVQLSVTSTMQRRNSKQRILNVQQSTTVAVNDNVASMDMH